MRQEARSATAAMLAVVGCIALVPAILLADGWMLSTAWGWLVVPLGVRPLSLIEAVGVAIVVGMVVPRTYVKRADGEAWEAALYPVMQTAVLFVVAWALHMIVG